MNSKLKWELGQGIKFDKPYRPSDEWRKNKVRKLSLKEVRARKAMIQKMKDDTKIFAKNIADAIIKIEKAKSLTLIEEIKEYFKEALVKSNPKF